jgi:hypothetical protein
MLARTAVVIALLLGCGGHAAPPPERPATTTVPIVNADAEASPRTGSPTKRVAAGMIQTGCSNGIYDCADDEICVIEHTGAAVARCVVDECPGAMSCDCSADACPGMQCDAADAARRTLSCSGGDPLAP